MKLRDIQDQLREFLPVYTDHFNSWNDASYSVVGGVATVTFVNHGLSAGDIVNIKDVVFPNPLIALTAVNGTAFAESSINTDLTTGFQDSIEIVNTGVPELEGTFSDFTVSDRNLFSYEVEPFFNGSDTGSSCLNEYNLARYNGKFTIDSVLDSDNFTVVVSNVQDFISSCKFSSFNSRIGVAFSYEDALDYYTQQATNDYWLFIIPDAVEVSKSRETETDFDEVYEFGNEIWQRIQEGVSFICIGKANDNITPLDIMDVMANDVSKALKLSLLGYRPPKTYCSDYTLMAFAGQSQYRYSDVTFSYIYAFTTTTTIVVGDTFIPQSIAVNKINIDYYDNNTNNKLIIAQDEIDYGSQ